MKHLESCEKRQLAIIAAERSKIAAVPLHHLRVQAAELSEFWLNLEMRGTATLADLDAYLRAIWLECCGHMSQFSFGGWRGEEIPKSKRISDVFTPGAELTHIYDFGTESVTLIKSLSIRQGIPTTRHPIALMARNMMPELTCIECGQPAAWLCMECIYDENTAGTLCDAHATTHPHEEYGEPLPLVNSPRLGMCGYDGPATPPYK